MGEVEGGGRTLFSGERVVVVGYEETGVGSTAVADIEGSKGLWGFGESSGCGICARFGGAGDVEVLKSMLSLPSLRLPQVVPREEAKAILFTSAEVSEGIIGGLISSILEIGVD